MLELQRTLGSCHPHPQQDITLLFISDLGFTSLFFGLPVAITLQETQPISHFHFKVCSLSSVSESLAVWALVRPWHTLPASPREPYTFLCPPKPPSFWGCPTIGSHLCLPSAQITASLEYSKPFLQHWASLCLNSKCHAPLDYFHVVIAVDLSSCIALQP